VSLPLNWNSILDSVFSQGIAPLLYNCLRGIPVKQCIPQGVMDKLKKAYHENIANNMYLYEELSRIIKHFNDKGIKIIVLKGAALAKAIYKDIGLRSMMDIDLLVKKEDLPYAKEIISDLNYIPKMLILSEEWYKKNHYHLPTYIHREKSLLVEIHWDITKKPFDINMEKWFERAAYEKFNGCKVLIPSPEDMIIHLCLHLYNHGYDSRTILRDLCDISETLKNYSGKIDWLLFQNEINGYGIHSPVYSILYLVKNFFDNVEILSKAQFIEPAHINRKLLKILGERMFIEDNIFSAMPGGLIKSLAVNSIGDKMRLLLPIIFPPREIMSKRHSAFSFSKKIYFYYLFRPFKLFRKYGKHLLTFIK
jgi:hypothetical protein